MERIDRHLLRQSSAGCDPSQSIMMNYSGRRLSISINANPTGMSNAKKLSRPCHESIRAFKQNFWHQIQISDFKYKREQGLNTEHPDLSKIATKFLIQVTGSKPGTLFSEMILKKTLLAEGGDICII